MDREQDIPFVYENGVLKPEGAVDLPEGSRGIARIRDVHSVGTESESTPSTASWKSRSLDEIAREQGILGPVDPISLRGDWPPDESIDEFLDEVRKGRR